MTVYMVFGVSKHFYLSSNLYWIVKDTPFMPFIRVITGEYPYPQGFRGEFLFVAADPRVCPKNWKQSTLSI